jgi:hypothetical protein
MNGNQSTVLAWHRQRYRVCPRDRQSQCCTLAAIQSATSRRSERSSNIPRREVNLGSVLRSFGTAATFDILVARIQTTGARGARLARVKAGGANACSKLTQIKRALFRLPRAGDRCPGGIQAAWLPRSSTFRRAFRSSRAQPAGPHHRARRLRARPFPAGA